MSYRAFVRFVHPAAGHALERVTVDITVIKQQAPVGTVSPPLRQLPPLPPVAATLMWWNLASDFTVGIARIGGGKLENQTELSIFRWTHSYHGRGVLLR